MFYGIIIAMNVAIRVGFPQISYYKQKLHVKFPPNLQFIHSFPRYIVKGRQYFGLFFFSCLGTTCHKFKNSFAADGKKFKYILTLDGIAFNCCRRRCSLPALPLSLPSFSCSLKCFVLCQVNAASVLCGSLKLFNCTWQINYLSDEGRYRELKL